MSNSKHSTYTARLNADCLGDMTFEGLTGLLREFGVSSATVAPGKWARVAAVLFKQVQQYNDLLDLLFDMLEAHRKLVRYEQRAFNQLRKNIQIKIRIIGF